MEAQPDAKIYCVGILPVTASQDAKGESVNNTNAKTFSTAISEVAAEVGAEYLDCSAAVADENGYLPEDASTDGIHMTSEYCLYWQDYIVDNS
jgi:lysophospholipase L1-like esterase